MTETINNCCKAPVFEIEKIETKTIEEPVEETLAEYWARQPLQDLHAAKKHDLARAYFDESFRRRLREELAGGRS